LLAIHIRSHKIPKKPFATHFATETSRQQQGVHTTEYHDFSCCFPEVASYADGCDGG
jgi:hypothetical protein